MDLRRRLTSDFYEDVHTPDWFKQPVEEFPVKIARVEMLLIDHHKS